MGYCTCKRCSQRDLVVKKCFNPTQRIGLIGKDKQTGLYLRFHSLNQAQILPYTLLVNITVCDCSF